MKKGRPKLKKSEKKKSMHILISPQTHRFISRQKEANGVFVDKLIQKETER